jgi:hypothetical protein
MKPVDSTTGEEIESSMIDREAASPRNFRYQVV